MGTGKHELTIQTRADIKARFASLFEKLRYTEYHDLTEPVIKVSHSGDLAWAAVNVRAVGARRSDNAPFDDQWAWIMLARKFDGKWVHAGNASNRKVR